MNSIKKTLLITIDFPPQRGGVANYLSNFSQNLPNNKIVILAGKKGEWQSFDDKQHYKIIRENLYYKNFWPKWLKTYFITKKIIKEEQIEQIIISHVLPMGYITLLLNKPFFIIFHGYDIMTAQKNAWKNFWLKLIMQKAKHLLVNSNFTKNQIIRGGISENKITIVHPCPNINPENLNKAEKEIIKKELELDSKKIMISVGRLVKRKGFDKVIEAMPEVIKKFPNLIYLIIGKGEYKKELEKLAENLQVRGNIIILEDIADSHLPCYYALADIFIMPSRIEKQTDVEGFGIVYLEANSFGKPVIAGKSGGVADAVIDGQTGILVEPNSASEIRKAILKLLTDQKLANKLGIQGQKRVKKEFQWPIQIAKLKNIL